MSFKVVAISDTHNRHNKLVIPECDILIHAGDATFQGKQSEVRNFAAWFSKQPSKYKIFVPGNHELSYEAALPESNAWFYEECPNGILLNEEEVIIEGIKIFGSPWTPWFHSWAFNAHRGANIKAHWDKIPADTNILITHGPVYGILDIVPYVDGTPKERVGCQDLLDAVKRIKCDLHICGHIHGSAGQHHEDGTSFYNASICDEQYMPLNPITIIEYEP